MTIQREVGKAQLGITAVKAAAHERSHSSQEFCQGKRLSKIVIGAGVQSGNPLLDQTSRSELQDRSFYALMDQLTADSVSLTPLQTYILMSTHFASHTF